MKKFVIATLCAVAFSTISWADIDCAEGNDAFDVTMLDGSTQEACCVPVGDGSVYSCTSDNKTWFNAA